MGFKEAVTNFTSKHRILTVLGVSAGCILAELGVDEAKKALEKRRIKKKLMEDIKDDTVVNYYFVTTRIEMNGIVELQFMSAWARIIKKLNVDTNNSSVMLYGFYGETNKYGRPVNTYRIAFNSIDDCAHAYAWLDKYFKSAIRGTSETVEINCGWNEAVYSEE